MTRSRKIALTCAFLLFIIALGSAYQYYYLEERTEYERAITMHYQKLYNKAPDPEKLRHLTTLALARYGPTEIDYQTLLKEAAA